MLQKTGDPLWQLPLWENYSSQLSSAHADFKNIGNSMFGGAITAALFLEKFVKDIPWIHVDSCLGLELINLVHTKVVRSHGNKSDIRANKGVLEVC